MNTKVVANGCFGGFGLSDEAIRLYGERTDNTDFYDMDLDRDDPVLVAVVEELGYAANGDCASLYIVEVPTGARWRIDEYDGNENVRTVTDYDWKVAT
jgi:hypothetical protein